MSTPGFVPANYLTYRKRGQRFGRAGVNDERWKEISPEKPDHLYAAIIQDLMAANLRTAIYDSGRTIGGFATEHGFTPQRMSRVTSGAALMRFQDLALMMRTFGSGVFPTWTSVAEDIQLNGFAVGEMPIKE